VVAEQLTDAELDIIERRCDAATPGPWIAYNAHANVNGTDVLTLVSLAENPACVSSGIWLADVRWNFYALNAECKDDFNDWNAAFIAKAREDVKRLVMEVRRLRADKKE
jgi:hypothetical protein